MIEGCEETCKGFTGSGRGNKQGVLTARKIWPGPGLNRRWAVWKMETAPVTQAFMGGPVEQVIG